MQDIFSCRRRQNGNKEFNCRPRPSSPSQKFMVNPPRPIHGRQKIPQERYQPWHHPVDQKWINKTRFLGYKHKPYQASKRPTVEWSHMNLHPSHHQNEYELTKVGFTTNYAVLVHHLKFHLGIFSKTPQGKSFTKLIDDRGECLDMGTNSPKLTSNNLS